jgi:two-component system, LuxR family, response regulator FixJ
MMTTDPCVYIVDDDPVAAESVEALVSSRGVATRVFKSAEEFLSAFHGDPGGCLVTDISMPGGMSGLELQDTLAERKCGMPVILITGYGDIPSAVKAVQKGAVTYLEKPPRERELWSHIKNALSQAAQKQTSDAERADIQARVDTLTPGELDVMRMIFAGVPNKQMVLDLEIGLRTVELRRAKVLEKLKVNSLAELFRLIFQWGGFADSPSRN